jgi:two-component system, chemotaxis family, protein-glutamate methylesterase/glutaminase
MNGPEKAPSQVRVLVVDDSAFMRAALTRMIQSEPAFEVVGTANSGSEALRKIAALDPEIVTLDVEMPGLDGLATLRQIMQRFPRPVIMVSAITEKNAEITFNALSAGAFDYVPKQMSSSSLEIAHIRSDLITKIYAAAQTRKPRALPERKLPQAHKPELALSHCGSAVIAIGASTGGPRALQEVLTPLPAGFQVPILVVQHMPAGFTTTFADRLDTLCAIQVREARQGEIASPGVAYIAPAGFHMRVHRRASDGRIAISLDKEPSSVLHMPSVDILMKSVAQIYRSRALGVIMTGMGSDGAEGMQAIYREGGITIGQDESSCTVYGMPRACAELGILTRVVPLSEMADQIMQSTRQRKPA